MATSTNKKGAAQPASKQQPQSPDNISGKLQELFENEVKDIYWAEKALTKAIPKMIKNATNEQLRTALELHLGETEGQVERLEKIFELLGKKAQAIKCEAMEGLIKEADEIMKETDKGPVRDAGIISAGQKVEHYEIASYGTLRAFAEILGHNEIAELLEETLEEEKGADEKLTEVTAMAVTYATEGGEEDEVEDEDEEEDEKV